jgi:LCP family protein required for cell wall assembly
LISGATPPPPPLVGAVAAGAPFTILLLGSDNDQKFATVDGAPVDPSATLTQSMILVRVQPATKQVTMLSIPRDLYVPFSLGGTSKIDEVHALPGGGDKASIDTVEMNFHIHIDYYIWIGLQGLISVIDKVGGIDVVTTNPVLDDAYPADLVGNNPYGFQRVAVLPGPQHMTGYQAMEYVRSRHSDARGDFGRSQRQQEVLLALRAKAKYLNATDIPDLASAFAGQLTTDMSITQVRELLPLAGSLSPSGIKQVTLVGGDAQLGSYTTAQVTSAGADVLIPNWSAILPLVHQDFPVA